MRSLRDGSGVPGCLPRRDPPLPSVLRLKASLVEVIWRLRRSPPTPLGHPLGYTRANTRSPFRRKLGWCCRCDNVQTMRQRREFMRLIPSAFTGMRPLACHVRPPCGATSISPVAQAGADHRCVCPGRRQQYTPYAQTWHPPTRRRHER